MNEVLRQHKRRHLEQMLDHGMVMVHLDPRLPEVVVPPRFTDDPVLRLNIAYGFNLPVLDVNATGVYAVLSFNRIDFPCTLPWDAVFAMTAPDRAHEGMVWPESVPAELAPFFADLGIERGPVPVSLEATSAPAEVEGAPAAEGPPADEAPEDAPRPPPVFRVHDGGRDDADDDSGPPDDAGPGPSTRPQLRLVKD